MASTTDERADVGQVERDRVGVFPGVRLQFRVEIDWKSEQ
jgi:hypothetical protein